MITISQATQDNLARISEIDRESISPPWSDTSFAAELENPDSIFLVAAEDGKTLGFIILRRVSIDEGEVFRIAVDRSARQRAVGDMLMRAALQYASENALRTLYLEVRESNKAAIALYLKYGFVETGRRKDYYDNPTEDAFIMTRSP